MKSHNGVKSARESLKLVVLSTRMEKTLWAKGSGHVVYWRFSCGLRLCEIIYTLWSFLQNQLNSLFLIPVSSWVRADHSVLRCSAWLTFLKHGRPCCLTSIRAYLIFPAVWHPWRALWRHFYLDLIHLSLAVFAKCEPGIPWLWLMSRCIKINLILMKGNRKCEVTFPSLPLYSYCVPSTCYLLNALDDKTGGKVVSGLNIIF